MTQAHALIEQWAELFVPPERLPLSKWVRKNFYLSSDYGAFTGLLEPFGWQEEILDSFTDDSVNLIALMTSTQMIKTLLMQCSLAYAIAEQPGPILLSQPSDEDARTFSKERLSPMIRDNPCLSQIIDDTKGRDASNTTLSKKFPNGSLSVVGSNAPGNFARRTIRYFLADEIDKYETTKEGDQISLGMERTMWFGSRVKVILACSPTNDGRSKIQKYFNQTDRRRPWVPCWKCAERQILLFTNVRFHRKGDPRSAVYHCPQCDAPWSDQQRWAAADAAEWRPEDPSRKAWRGYWISHLYSRKKKIAGESPMESIAANFLASKDDREKLKVFVNTNLAELWRDEGERPDWHRIKNRAEDYPFNEDAVVPMRATFLTAAVDIQKDWIIVELKAWGRGKENWSLGTWKIEQFDSKMNVLQTSDPSYRAWLQAFLERQWAHQCGVKLPIMAMGLDTGNRPDPVYELCRVNSRLVSSSVGARIHHPRTVVPLKGSSTTDQHSRLIVSVSDENAARKRGGVRIVTVGSGFAKTEFYGNLDLRRKEDGEFPAGYCHFPRYDDAVFESICSEERVVKANGGLEWVKLHPRNESLDLHVYNRAMASLVGIDAFSERQWDDFDRNFGIDRRPKAEIEREIAATPAIEAAKRRSRVRFRMEL